MSPSTDKSEGSGQPDGQPLRSFGDDADVEVASDLGSTHSPRLDLQQQMQALATLGRQLEAAASPGLSPQQRKQDRATLRSQLGAIAKQQGIHRMAIARQQEIQRMAEQTQHSQAVETMEALDEAVKLPDPKFQVATQTLDMCNTRACPGLGLCDHLQPMIVRAVNNL